MPAPTNPRPSKAVTETDKSAEQLQILTGDCREVLATLPDSSVQCCVTSPPYWGLRDYGHSDQIGLEETPAQYVESIVEVFREVRRVLKDDGTLWLNLGDSYIGSRGGGQGKNGQLANRSVVAARCRVRNKTLTAPELKNKDLAGIPWRVAFALQDDGWWLRSDIIWNKPNCMPESVKDRPTRNHEYLFLLTKSEHYRYDYEAIKEPGVIPAGTRAAKGSSKRGEAKGVNGRPPEYWEYDGMRNKRTVWTVKTRPYKEAHFAVFPPELVTPCVLAGAGPGDTVLDPFGGSGTTGQVAMDHGRRAILIEINPEYAELANGRTSRTVGLPL